MGVGQVKLRLFRFYQDSECTLGVLSGEGLPPIYTIERPWLDNKRKVSCIPTGTYTCVPHNGTRFKNVWRLENVPNRDAILIHAGNTVDDVIGCVAIGLEHDKLKGKRAVLRSAEAIAIMRNNFKGVPSFTLEIF
jgi:hypothetical protein